DVAVELDVIEAVLRRFHLQRVFFRDVAQFFEIRMAEERVVVEIDLGVKREQPTVRGCDKGIDLKQWSVRCFESLKEAGHELHGLIDQRRLDSKLKCQFARLESL